MHFYSCYSHTHTIGGRGGGGGGLVSILHSTGTVLLLFHPPFPFFRLKCLHFQLKGGLASRMFTEALSTTFFVCKVKPVKSVEVVS
jgi:hypothetical protein